MSNLSHLPFDWTSTAHGLPADTMDRSAHAQFLTALLVTKGTQGSYVLNLNAGWGSGKTYFLKRWMHEVQTLYPAVYIDAWSNDHSSDPLLNVVSEIRKCLKSKKDINELENKLFTGFFRVMKAAAPKLAKSIIKNTLEKKGIDISELAGLVDNDETAEWGAQLVENAIKVHDEASVGVGEMKKSILGWLESIVTDASTGYTYPLFVFIDELDRCRPTYAVEMLETIKHIFDMKNVVFVVATDKEQLQHSIRVIYGDGFNARVYLDRFFNRSVTLNEISRKNFIQERVSKSVIFSDYCSVEKNFPLLANSDTHLDDVCSILTDLSDAFKMPLRTVDLWLDRIEVALGMGDNVYDIILLSYFMAVETQDSDSLGKIIRSYETDLLDNTPLIPDSFLIKLQFSYSMVPECSRAFENNTASMQVFAQRSYCIDIIDYIRIITQAICLSTLNDGSDLVSAIIKKCSRSVNYGENNIEVLERGDDAREYDKAITDIVTLFHIRHKITMSNYYDICKLSTHLN